jgi:TnpA family transposase
MILFENINEAKKYLSNIENKKNVYESLIEDIIDALIFDLDRIIIYKYEKENIEHYLYSDSWINSLKKALKYFEYIEDYLKCIEIRDLIIVLEDILPVVPNIDIYSRKT